MGRLVNRRTGSVVVVPDEKDASLKILGFEPESGASKSAAKKAPAKKATSSKSSK